MPTTVLNTLAVSGTPALTPSKRQGITAVGAAKLCASLQTNMSLTILDCSWNGPAFGLEGGKAIARALQSNRSLITLRADGNAFGDEGAQALAEALVSNGHLSELHLSHNDIGEMGGQALCEMLQDNRCLQKFSVHHNNLGSVFGLALGRMLRVNRTLQILNAGEQKYDLGVEAHKLIRQALLDHPSVTDLIC